MRFLVTHFLKTISNERGEVAVGDGGATVKTETPGNQNNTPPATPAAGTPPEFSSIIPKEFVERPWVKDTKDIPSLFKRVDDLLVEVGKKPAGIPQDNAKPEEWNDFNKAFGVPEKPEMYEFGKVPEGLEVNPDFQNNMKGILHKAGVSKRQSKVLEEGFNAMLLQVAKGQAEANEKVNKDFDALADSTFGERKAKVMETGRALIAKFIPESLKSHIDKLPNESLMVLAGVLDGVAKQYIKEDDLPKGAGAGTGNMGEQQRRDEGKKLMASEAYRNPLHAEHDATVRKVRELYQTV